MTVKLKALGVGEKHFDVEHAQRILDIKTAPKVWKLADENFELIEGKITQKQKPQEDDTDGGADDKSDYESEV